MPHSIVFGFGNPPSQLLLSIHQQAEHLPEPPQYHYQPLNLDLLSVERSLSILHSSHVVGCHFEDALEVRRCEWLRVGPGARSSGRVNVVYKEQLQLIGEDTLSSGALRALQGTGFQVAGSRVLMLGSTAEAQSLVRSLASLGMSKLSLVHGSLERVRTLATALKRDIPTLSVLIGSLMNENLQELVYDVDLLIMAMDPADPSSHTSLPVSLSLPDSLVVFDLFPGAAQLLNAQNSVRSISAQSLLMCQLAECFQLWNKQELPLSILQKAINDAEDHLY